MCLWFLLSKAWRFHIIPAAGIIFQLNSFPGYWSKKIERQSFGGDFELWIIFMFGIDYEGFALFEIVVKKFFILF